MESSIAEFVERQLACELLPTESRQDQALKLVKCFGHLKRVGSERVLRTNKQKKSRVCGFQQVSHAVVCIFQAHQSKAVVCMFQAQSCSELKLHMLRHVTHRVCGFQQVGHAVVCMFQAHQSKAVVCMFQAQSCSELKLHMLRLRFVADSALFHLQTRPTNLQCGSYLLGLLAMIKCSICSYQCDS